MPGLVNKSALQSWYTDFKTVFNDALMAWEKSEDDWKKIAMQESCTGDRGEYGWLGDPPRVREWTGTRVISGYNSGSYAIENKWWEVTVNIKCEDMNNEKAGMNRKKVRQLPYSFGEDIEDMVWTALADASDPASLCLDGQPLCSSAHPLDAGETHFKSGATTQSNEDGAGATTWMLIDARNPGMKGLPVVWQYNTMPTFQQITSWNSDHVFKNREYLFGGHGSYNVGYGIWQTCYRSTQALTAANFWAAYKAMCDFSDRKGRPYRARPNLIVTGTTYADAAYQMFDPQSRIDPAGNIEYSFVKLGITPIISPYIV